jgi:hypothetical protein
LARGAADNGHDAKQHDQTTGNWHDPLLTTGIPAAAISTTDPRSKIRILVPRRAYVA